MSESIKIMLLSLFVGFFIRFMIDISTEMKSINANLTQINQTMQEQNKIFGTSPEEEILEVNNDWFGKVKNDKVV